LQKEEKSKQKAKQRPTYWYEVDPTPFELLSDSERDRIEGAFTELLNVVNNGTIIISKSTEKYTYENEDYEVLYYKFLVKSDVQLSDEFFNARQTQLVRPKVVKEYPRYVKLENGQLAQSAVVYRYPLLLPEGFLYEYFDLADEIVFKFKALDPIKSASMVDTVRRRLESIASTDSSSYTLQKLEKVKQLQSIIGGNAKLLEYYVWFIYYGKDENELKEKYNQLKLTAKARLLDIDVPVFFQEVLYEYGVEINSPIPFANKIIPKYVDTLTAAVFYPFINENLIDEEGIFLGVSDSGSPIILNPYRRQNYNIVILGSTGSGKSMTTKVMLKRLKENFEDLYIAGIDPENEYVIHSRVFGAESLLVQPGQHLGLDPIKFMNEGLLQLEEVADLLADFYLPENDVVLKNKLRRSLFEITAEDTKEFLAIIQQKNTEIYNYLAAMDAPPDAYVFDGQPIDFRKNVIVGLNKLGNNRRLKALTMSLLSVFFTKELFSNKNKGFFFIDEAWLFINYPATIGILENLARRARKYNKGLIFVTQRPEDIAKNEQGKTILEQAATSILLGQNDSAIPALKEIYNLRQEEAEELVTATKGRGIIRSGKYVLRIQVLPTQEELEMFKTTGQWGGE